MEGPLHKGHEDHIAGTGINSLNHYNLVHIFPMLEALKNSRCKGGSGKMRKTEENSGMAADESPKQKRGDR